MNNKLCYFKKIVLVFFHTALFKKIADIVCKKNESNMRFNKMFQHLNVSQ